MAELKAYKICDIDIRAIIGQKQRFWLWLHGYFAVQYGLTTACVSASRAVTLLKKAGRQSVSIALSQRSARSKKRHLLGGPCQHEKRGNGSLYGFTGQGTSLGAQRHAAVVDAHAFRPPQYDIGYARVRGTVVQGVHY